jgi:hypothetical protein
VKLTKACRGNLCYGLDFVASFHYQSLLFVIALLTGFAYLSYVERKLVAQSQVRLTGGLRPVAANCRRKDGFKEEIILIRWKE